MNVPVRDDQGRDCTLVAVTGGDYNQWAIVHYGSGRLYARPLSDIEIVPVAEVEETRVWEQNKRAFQTAGLYRPAPVNAIAGPQTGRGVR